MRFLFSDTFLYMVFSLPLPFLLMIFSLVNIGKDSVLSLMAFAR